jgi:site-specific DNA-methyltransferase (adenine-specific)
MAELSQKPKIVPFEPSLDEDVISLRGAPERGDPLVPVSTDDGLAEWIREYLAPVLEDLARPCALPSSAPVHDDYLDYIGERFARLADEGPVVREVEEFDMIDVERFRRLGEDLRRRQPTPATWLRAARRPRTHRPLGRRTARRCVPRAARRASSDSSDLPPGASVHALVGGASTLAASVQHLDLRPSPITFGELKQVLPATGEPGGSAAPPAANPANDPVLEDSISPWLNKIHHGDCVALMDEMPAGSVDLIVTSPPYNIRSSTGGGMRSRGSSLWRNAALKAGYAGGYTDNMPYPDYVAWQRKCLTAMMRVLKDDGAIFYNHKRRVQNGLIQDCRKILEGFPLRQIIIWHRSGGICFNLSFFLPTSEEIYLICREPFRLAKSKDPKHPKATCGIGDVWKFRQDRGNDHPAPFPVEIPKRCIESTDARIVLDPFMGSGTTAIAAEMLGREWIGIEVASEYCSMAEERIAAWRRQPPRLGGRS